MSSTVSADSRTYLGESEAWKRKFDLLEKVGADKMFLYKAMGSTAYKQLGFKDKYRLTTNLAAFLFGPLYYCFKGMWIKGAVLLATGWVIAALFTGLESIIGLELPSIFYWLPSAVLCSQLSNYDYYRKVVHGETIWQGMPEALGKPVGAIAFLIVAIAILGAAVTWMPPTRAQMLDDATGVWRGDSDGQMVVVSLAGSAKYVKISGTTIPVRVTAIDRRNSVITLGVRMANGQNESWALRQLFSHDGHFTLQLTLQDGTQDTLSFVRNL